MNPSKPMRIGSRAARLAAGLLAAIILGETARAADPILHYTFNTPGTNAPSTGTDTTPLYLLASAGVYTNLHGGPGSGTTGQPGDRCLDFSSATGMGSGDTGPLAKHLASVDSIKDLKSFTQSGWYKTSHPGELPVQYARMLENYWAGWGSQLNAGGGGSELYMTILDDGPDFGASSPAASFNQANTWYFFAVTYDGTLSTNNVRFYRGYLNAIEAGAKPAFACLSTNTIDEGTVLMPNGAILAVGNSLEFNRPFRGYFDNIRVYGSKTDASGVLTDSEVEAIWTSETRPGTNLLLEYTFDETGTEAPSSGYYDTPLSLRDASDALTDLHGPAGSGVSGEPDDRALDLSSASAMGVAGTGPIARHTADFDAVDTLASITITGWYKTSFLGEALANYANLVNNTVSSTGYILQGNSSTTKGMAFAVNNAGGGTTVNNLYADANKWVFVAATYDSTATTNNLRFYRGYRNQIEAAGKPLLACVQTNTYLEGIAANDGVAFCVGNRPGRDRTLRGYMDNVRLFGSKRDGSGALDADAIAAIRAADYPAVRASILIVR